MKLSIKMTADSSCGGVTAYNCLSGEPVIKLDEGRPMYFRTPDSTLTLGSFFRAQLYSSFTALKIGMDILFDKEQVKAEKITGHGGLFKVSGVASQLMADALSTPVSVMKTGHSGSSTQFSGIRYGDSRRGRRMGHGYPCGIYGAFKWRKACRLP